MEWEQSKENIQPLKKGRSVKGLGGFRDKLSIDQSEKDYFQKLEAARTISTQDLLNIYIEFYSWIRRTCNDNEKGKILLEVRITCIFLFQGITLMFNLFFSELC